MKYNFENYTLDVERRELHCDGTIRSVEPQVFDLLHFLIKNSDRVVSRKNIFQAVWGGRIVSDAVLGTRINAARRAIGDDGTQQRLIKTLPRSGFRFTGAVHEVKVEMNDAIIIPRGKFSLAIVPSAPYDGDEKLTYISKGIADDLTVALARNKTFDVIAHNRICGDGDDPRLIVRELGVGYLIIYGLRRAGDEVRLSVRLIESYVGLHIWAQSYTRGLSAGFVDQDAITHKSRTQLSHAFMPRKLGGSAKNRTMPALEVWCSEFCGSAVCLLLAQSGRFERKYPERKMKIF